MIKMTKAEARNFILNKQGLCGQKRFKDKAGCLAFIKQAGCIQFDPIDRCGRNIDLVLYSRVEHYHKEMLDALLYKDYLVVDQWDKNMSIYAVEDWASLTRTRLNMADRYDEHMKPLQDDIKKVMYQLENVDYVEANDLEITATSEFFTWRHKKLSQAILDYLFFKGDVVVHHRQGIKRYFGLAKKYINQQIYQQQDPFKTQEAFQCFMIKRRIGAVGMLGQGASDAYLGIYEMKARDRRKRYETLLAQDEIIVVTIEGVKGNFYILASDKQYINHSHQDIKRVEFIAPLDSFLWDRTLIKQIFDFDYKWEIYTPEKNRVYGPYVLPILYGNQLIGRIDIMTVTKTNTLHVQNIWFEDVDVDDTFWALLHQRIVSFAAFNQCMHICIGKQMKKKLRLMDRHLDF